MTTIRTVYLEAAAPVVALLRDPAVTAAWAGPSALAEFTVGGLAGHLARQITNVPVVLATPLPEGTATDGTTPEGWPISLAEHYARSAWSGADLQDEVNVMIRRAGEQEAAEGGAALAARTVAALEELQAALPAEPAGRLVYIPWGPWSLSLDDFLITRMLEIAVHSDDLAVSTGIAAPPLPAPALDTVLAVLAQLAVRKHGQAAVLSSFTRAERAPATITVF